MPQDQWKPNAQSKHRPMLAKPRRSTLQTHIDERIRNLGNFCAGAPDTMPPNEVAYSGVLIGLGFAFAHPDEAAALLPMLLETTGNPDLTSDEKMKAVVELGEAAFYDNDH